MNPGVLRLTQVISRVERTCARCIVRRPTSTSSSPAGCSYGRWTTRDGAGDDRAGRHRSYELGHRLGISSGSTTELVDRLERAGHLERRRDTADRRRVLLQPSPTAVAQILTELGPVIAALDAVGDDFTAAEQAVIARYLRAVAEVLLDYAGVEERSTGRPSLS